MNLYEYSGRSMPVFYTIFIGVIGRRDFLIICPILPKSYRDSADFLPCDFLTARNPNPNPNTNSNPYPNRIHTYR